MKKFKLAVVMLLASMFISTSAFAQNIGVVNYKNVLMNYNYAKETELNVEKQRIIMQKQLKQLPGMSGHADKAGLLRWIQGFKTDAERVFVVHGEDSVCMNYTETLKGLGFNAYAPYSGTRFDLARNEFIYEASPVIIQHKIFTNKKANTVFARLLAAGQRLLEVIKKLEGRPNKELGKFADQINALADRMEK